MQLEELWKPMAWRAWLATRRRPRTVHPGSRFWEVDAVRGLAVVMMVIYHLMYDLYYFQITDAIFTVPFWFYFQRTTASTFILLVGISLAILYQRTQARGEPGRVLWRQNWRRGVRIFGWGMVITAVTWLVLGPRLAIKFGVLHFIGVSIVMATPFLRFRWLNLGLGVLLILAGKVLQRRTFDWPWLVWLGFEPANHVYVDYFPVIPWFGVVLIGLFLGNFLYHGKARRFHLPNLSDWPPVRGLEWLGLRSLTIYLLHQPVLLAILLPLLRLLEMAR
ncbi:MAG: membrane protein [Litorilinea sp.]|nr:MAG: membrane protein [Litorilinea sp.]